MKPEIKLKNPKFCNGCPLSWGEEALDNEYGDRFLGRVCRLGYWTKKGKFTDYINMYIEKLFVIYEDMVPGDVRPLLVNRPQKCIEENGE